MTDIKVYDEAAVNGSRRGLRMKAMQLYRCGRCCRAWIRDPRPCRSHSVPGSRRPWTPQYSVQYWSATGYCRWHTFPANGLDLRPPTHAHRLTHKSSIRMPSGSRTCPASNLCSRTADYITTLLINTPHIDHSTLQITTNLHSTVCQRSFSQHAPARRHIAIFSNLASFRTLRWCPDN